MEISGHRWQRCHESKIQKSRLCFLCFGVGKRKYEITDLLWGSVIVWPDDNQTCSEFKSWFSLSVSNRRGLLKLRLLYFLLSWHPFKSDNIDITSWYLNIERMKGCSALGTRHVQPGSMMQFAQPSSLNSGKMKEESLVRCTNPKMVQKSIPHLCHQWHVPVWLSFCGSLPLQILACLCAGKLKQEAVLASSHSSPGSMTPFRQVFKHTSQMIRLCWATSTPQNCKHQKSYLQTRPLSCSTSRSVQLLDSMHSATRDSQHDGMTLMRNTVQSPQGRKDYSSLSVVGPYAEPANLHLSSKCSAMHWASLWIPQCLAISSTAIASHVVVVITFLQDSLKG